MTKIVTSESVNCGHPDKTCDIIADSFLDEALRQDKYSQMAVECAIKDDLLMIYGEATTKANIDYESIANKILKDIGYKNDFKFIKKISSQSVEINHAINKQKICANDQGIVFGYATNETKEYMPLPILIAHKLMQKYEEYRRKNSDTYFADAKSQVSVKYVDDKPVSLDTILVSVSHKKGLNNNAIFEDINCNVILPVLKDFDIDCTNLKTIINPSGEFSIWGSFSDSGCVGRKIVVDTYGGVGHVGGGCFSSKNATKVDRSGAYYARYIAKNIVAHNLCDRCEIELSFGIGLDRPISLRIDCFGTNKVDIEKIYKFVNDNFDLSIQNMIDELDLLRPIYAKTACYGHFGRAFSWEKIKTCKL